MGAKPKEIGGGPAVGLANDFVKWLEGGLNTGRFGGTSGIGAVSAAGKTSGADPIGSTMGISGILNDLLSGGAGKVGGAMSDMISKANQRAVEANNARFGATGGTAFGTGAQHANAVLQAEEAPQLTTAIGNLQMQAMAPLLQMMASLSSKGISQREAYLQTNPWLQAASTVSDVAKAAVPFFSKVPGGGGNGSQAGISPDAMSNFIDFINAGPRMSSIGFQ